VAVSRKNFGLALERTTPIIEALHDAGIHSSMYASPPSGKDVFILGQSRGVPGGLLIWPGSERVDISVSTNKRQRQAVLAVTEESRTLSSPFRIIAYFDEAQISVREWRKDASTQASMYWKGPALPGTARFQFCPASKIRFEETSTGQASVGQVDGTLNVRKHRSLGNPRRHVLGGRIIAKVPATELTFLVGVDEVTHFVSLLPEAASSVTEAHRVLRPTEISKGAKRQGEFFFEPVISEEMLKTLNKRKSFRSPSSGLLGYALEIGSSHRAEYLQSYEETEYVKGRVFDTRTGHHKDLTLKDWHRVERNLEIAAPRRQRWD